MATFSVIMKGQDNSSFSASMSEEKKSFSTDFGATYMGLTDRSVISANINDNGELELVYANGDTEILGVVVGRDGNDGIDGKDGVDGLPGKDGKDGADGYTPIKGKDYFDGVNGKDGKDGVDGKNGIDGKDGYTPQKGTDYWTPADKAEMVNDVISALPKYNGEVVSV